MAAKPHRAGPGPICYWKTARSWTFSRPFPRAMWLARRALSHCLPKPIGARGNCPGPSYLRPPSVWRRRALPSPRGPAIWPGGLRRAPCSTKTRRPALISSTRPARSNRPEPWSATPIMPPLCAPSPGTGQRPFTKARWRVKSLPLPRPVRAAERSASGISPPIR